MVPIDTNFKKDVLPDILDFNLRLVFCGSAPSPTSAAQHAYYAGFLLCNKVGTTPFGLILRYQSFKCS